MDGLHINRKLGLVGDLKVKCKFNSKRKITLYEFEKRTQSSVGPVHSNSAESHKKLNLPQKSQTQWYSKESSEKYVVHEIISHGARVKEVSRHFLFPELLYELVFSFVSPFSSFLASIFSKCRPHHVPSSATKNRGLHLNTSCMKRQNARGLFPDRPSELKEVHLPKWVNFTILKSQLKKPDASGKKQNIFSANDPITKTDTRNGCPVLDETATQISQVELNPPRWHTYSKRKIALPNLLSFLAHIFSLHLWRVAKEKNQQRTKCQCRTQKINLILSWANTFR